MTGPEVTQVPLAVVTVGGATGRVTATALKGRTKVAGGRAAAKNGSAKVRVRFTKSARPLARAQALGAADDPRQGGHEAECERDAQTSVS